MKTAHSHWHVDTRLLSSPGARPASSNGKLPAATGLIRPVWSGFSRSMERPGLC